VVPNMTLWYLSLNPVVGRFGTNYELNSSEDIIATHFGFMVGNHDVTQLGSHLEGKDTTTGT